jgi:predicted phage terminase large subunit-like protein
LSSPSPLNLTFSLFSPTASIEASAYTQTQLEAKDDASLCEMVTAYEWAAKQDPRPQTKATLAAILEELWVRAARRDPVAFIEYALSDDKTGLPLQLCPMHREWQELMGQQSNLVLLAPREHGKSTNIVGRIIWELGRNANTRVKIVSNNSTNAQKRLRAIKKHIESNPRVHRVFPHLRPDYSKWAETAILVRRSQIMIDSSVEAFGVFAAATGSRCDILIFDDVADMKNSILNPADREKVKETVLSDWMNMLVDGGWVVDIATLWHKADLHHHLGGSALKAFLRGEIPDQTEIEAGQWYVSFHAVGDGFEAVWPEQWPTSRLKAKFNSIGTKAFNRGFRNRAIDDEDTVIKPAWISYFNRNLPPRNELILIQSYDLALSESMSSKADYFARVTAALAVSPSPRLFILEAWRERLNFPSQVEVVLEAYKRLSPDVIVIESTAYQAALAQHVRHEKMLPVRTVKPNKSKRIRLESVSPLLESGQILFSPRLDPDRSVRVTEQGDLVTELLEFPLGDHDDLVDALTQLVNYVQLHLDELISWQSGVATGEGTGVDLQVQSF